MPDRKLSNIMVLVAAMKVPDVSTIENAVYHMGATLDVARDGADLFERLKTKRYDLVLTDLSADNIDSIQRIRKEQSDNFVVIAIADGDSNSEQISFSDTVLNGWIGRPVTVEKLNREIERLLPETKIEAADSHILTNQGVSVDVSMLYEISGDDESYISLMVQTFLKNMPGTLAKMNQSLLEEDWESLFRSAHSAKSSLSVIKVSGMFEAVFSVEQNARNRMNLETLPALVAQINKLFRLAEEVLARKFNTGL